MNSTANLKARFPSVLHKKMLKLAFLQCVKILKLYDFFLNQIFFCIDSPKVLAYLLLPISRVKQNAENTNYLNTFEKCALF